MPVVSTQSPWGLLKCKLWAEMYFLRPTLSAAQRALVNAARLSGIPFADLLSSLAFALEKVEFEVVQFMSEIGLNEIPGASALLALGRQADDINKASEVHKRLNSMKMLTPVKIWMQIEASTGEPNADIWPDAPFVAFEGWCTGAAIRKSSQGVDLTLSITHWLADLNFSSSVSRHLQPMSASQLSFWSSIPFGPLEAGGGGERNMVGVTAASRFFNRETVQKDLWAFADNKGIKAFLKQVCDIDAFAFLPSNPANLTAQVTPNTEALRALNRFEPLAAEGAYKYGSPLTMGLGDATESIAGAIANDIASTMFLDMVGVTIWDKLMAYSGDYLIAVAPMVDRALLVPFQPGIRGGYRRTIKVSEYDHIESSYEMPRPLRSVCLYLGRPGAQAGADGAQGDQAPPDSFNGACYDASIGDPSVARGMVMFKQAPAWLSGVVPLLSFPTPANIMSNAIMPNIGGGMDVAAANAVLAAYNAIGRPADVLRAINPALLRYAKSTYAYEVLRGRQGHLSGKLRFDIGPGSTVRIEGSEDRALTGTNTALEETQYATVTKVITAINAETGGANTAFQLAFMRNETENTVDRTSVAEHPVWNGDNSKWFGCPLIDNAAFGLPRVE